MHPIQRVMRIMTHVDIGAALGMSAWIAWSGAHPQAIADPIAKDATRALGRRGPDPFFHPL